MKICFCISILFITIFVHAMATTKEARDMETIEKQVTKKGLTLSAALPKKCFAGERIDVVITIKNQRKDDVVYYEISPARDFNIAALDSKGKPISLTDFGKLMLPKDTNSAFKLVKKVLSSGKEVRLTINLARLFDLTIGNGDYSVHLSRELLVKENNATKPMQVKLNLEIPFKVSEPPK